MKKYKREALEQKYRARPFLGIEAGKNVVLSEINKFLDRAENGRYSHPLYTDDEITAVMHTIATFPEHDAYRRYIRLCQWTSHFHTHVRAFLDTAKALLFYALEMLSHALSMEQVEATIRASASSEEIYAAEEFTFRTTDLSRFTYVESDEFNLMQTWNTVKENLRFAQAYNKAIELIAKEIKIPEYKCFMIDYTTITSLIENVLEYTRSLEAFIETRSGYEGAEKEIRERTLLLFEQMYSTAETPLSDTAIKTAARELKHLDTFAHTENTLISILMADPQNTEAKDDTHD